MTLERVECLVAERWVVTVHETPIEVFDDYRRRAEGSGDVGRLDGVDFLAGLLEWVLEAYLRSFEAVELALEELDTKVLEGSLEPPEQELRRLVELRRVIGRLRRALVSHRQLFLALARPELEAITRSDHADRFAALRARLEDVVQAARDSRDSIVGSFDIVIARTEQRTNEIVKVLTLGSLLLLPGALLAGIMGMNFKLGIFEDTPLLLGGARAHGRDRRGHGRRRPHAALDLVEQAAALAREDDLADLAAAPGGVPVAFLCGDDRPLHEDVPAPCEVLGLGDPRLLGQAGEKASDDLEMPDRRLVHRARVVVARLDEHVDERAAFEVVSLEPVVEDVEDREQPLLRGFDPLLDLALQPVPRPALFAAGGGTRRRGRPSRRSAGTAWPSRRPSARPRCRSRRRGRRAARRGRRRLRGCARERPRRGCRLLPVSSRYRSRWCVPFARRRSDDTGLSTSDDHVNDAADELGRATGDRPALRRYGVALLLTLGALLAAVLLQQIAEEPIYAPLAGVVAIVVWYGGIGPAVLSIVVGWAFALGLFVEPYPFAEGSGDDMARWGVNLAVALAIGWAAGALQQSRERASTVARTVQESVHEMAGIQALTTSLSAAVTPSDVAHALLEETPALVGARGGSLGLVDGDELEIVDPRGVAGQTHQPGLRLPLGVRAPIAKAARTGDLVVVRDRETFEREFPEGAALTLYAHGALAVPASRRRRRGRVREPPLRRGRDDPGGSGDDRGARRRSRRTGARARASLRAGTRVAASARPDPARRASVPRREPRGRDRGDLPRGADDLRRRSRDALALAGAEARPRPERSQAGAARAGDGGGARGLSGAPRGHRQCRALVRLGHPDGGARRRAGALAAPRPPLVAANADRDRRSRGRDRPHRLLELAW